MSPHPRRLALVALALLTACTSARGTGDLGSPPGPTAPADTPTTGTRDAVKAAPRWVGVTRLTGTGHRRSPPFDIPADALQWRVTVTCQAGHVRVGVAGEPTPLVDQECPGRYFGFSARTGSPALDIQASGEVEVVVDRQTEEPLAEPPLPGMGEPSRLAIGAISGVEQEGTGTVTLFRLPEGGRALRLDPFFVTANDDLFVWASEAEAPRTSAEAFNAPHVQLGALKATAGAQNYALPGSLPPERICSIVIWCEPVRTAYAAAPLRRR